MSHGFSWRRDGVALLLGLAVLCSVLAALGAYVLDKQRWAEQTLSDIEPRHARLAGLARSGDAIDKVTAAAREQLARYVYSASEDLTQAGNDAQQRVRDIFTKAGLQVVSSQVLPARDEKLFDRIPLAVRVEGELAGVQNALAALPGQTPAILIDSVAIQNSGMTLPAAGQRLNSQFGLSVLRSKR